MGCIISSKLRPEDVVGRCKARKRFIKEAVEQRHAFAAAYAAYLVALRNTGAALRQFAEEEGGMPACGLQGPIPEPPPPPPLHDPSSSATHDSASPCYLAYEPLRSPDPSLNLKAECSPMTANSSTRVDQEEHTPPGRMSVVVINEADVDLTNAGHITDASTLMKHHSFASANPCKNNTMETAIINSTDDGDVGNLEHELSLMLKLNAKKDLPQIVREIDEEFLKAYAGGTEVVRRTLEMRISSQAVHSDLYSKARAYKSARVFSAFSWNWSRNLLNNRAEVGSKHLDEAQQQASHALTLERLLAWEKKLYEEVKVVEILRAEQAKKCSILRCQETRAEDAAHIEKTRVELKKLHSLILVCNHRVDSTIEAIEDLRDDELHHQLVELIGGLMNMWITMHQSHARQAQIIVHMKNIDAMMSQQPTSESHHQATLQLEKELLGWHHTFCKLVASQKGYVAALYGWIKLSLIPISTGKVKGRADDDCDDNHQMENLETYRLCEEWQRALGCLPDRVASEAIKSLAEVVKAMVAKQAEEMKQKKKTEKLGRMWEKKVRALQPLEEEEQAAAAAEERSRRRRSWREQGDIEEEGQDIIERSDVGVLMERKAAVAAMRKQVEGEMVKHCKAVQDTRVLTMNNLQTGLPGVLEAMTGFSAVCSQAFQHLHSLTHVPPHSCYTCY